MNALKVLHLDSVPFAASPVIFWDLFGQQGHPIRTTISEIGPLLISADAKFKRYTRRRIYPQYFRIADDQGLLLIDFQRS